MFSFCLFFFFFAPFVLEASLCGCSWLLRRLCGDTVPGSAVCAGQCRDVEWESCMEAPLPGAGSFPCTRLLHLVLVDCALLAPPQCLDGPMGPRSHGEGKMAKLPLLPSEVQGLPFSGEAAHHPGLRGNVLSPADSHPGPQRSAPQSRELWICFFPQVGSDLAGSGRP